MFVTLVSWFYVQIVHSISVFVCGKNLLGKLDLLTLPLYYQPHIPHRSPWVCLEDKTDLVFVHVCDSIVA